MLKRLIHFDYLKIRDKLVIYFICLIILPITIIFLFTYTKLSDVVKNKISNYSSVIVRSICDDIDKTLNSTTDAKYFVLPNEAVQSILLEENPESDQDSINNIQNIIRSIISARDYVISITIMNNDGFSYFYSRLAPDEPHKLDEIKANGFYDEIIKGNGRMVWNRFDRGRNSYTLGMQLLSLNKLKGIGIMLIDFDMNQINKIYTKSKVEKSGKFYIVDRNGEIIFHTDREKLGQKVASGFLDKLSSSKQHIFSNWYENSEYMTISYISSVVDWRYIYEVPKNEMMKEIILIRDFLFLVFGGGVILAVIFAVIISFGMTNPINQLMKHMKKAETGDLNARVKVKTRDEIGQLGEKFNKMIANIQNLINTVYKEELMRKNAETEALQAQINPHFMYNTLDSINALAELKGVDDISKITVAFSKLLRASISNDKNIISLREEISYVTNYMTIIKIRYNNRINFITDLQEESLEFRVPKLIIQPLVENSIVHGLADKTDYCEVKIKSYIREDILYIEVKDNGKGMETSDDGDPDAKKGSSGGHSGFGLSNVKKRIELMYGKGYGVEINGRRDQGTTVTLKLPNSSADGEVNTND